MLADRPRAVAALTKIFLDEIERLLCAAAGVTRDAATTAYVRPRLGAVSFLLRFGSALNHHVHLHVCATDGVFVPATAEAARDTPPAFLPARPINQADLAVLTDVPSYFRSLEHLLRYCTRPPFALERLSMIRGPAGRISRVRYVLPRHKAANWVGRGRGRKSTRPGANGVVELTPFEFLDRLPISCRRLGFHPLWGCPIADPTSIRKILTPLGESLEPPPVSPARGPPADWAELVQAHDDRDVFQASPDELVVIDIHSLKPASKPRERPTGTRSAPTREKRHRRGEATRFGNAFLGPGTTGQLLMGRS